MIKVYIITIYPLLLFGGCFEEMFILLKWNKEKQNFYANYLLFYANTVFV